MSVVPACKHVTQDASNHVTSNEKKINNFLEKNTLPKLTQSSPQLHYCVMQRIFPVAEDLNVDHAVCPSS